MQPSIQSPVALFQAIENLGILKSFQRDLCRLTGLGLKAERMKTAYFRIPVITNARLEARE